MTVQVLEKTAKQILQIWESQAVARREQHVLQSHFGQETTYQKITDEIKLWVEILGSLALKPRVSQSISRSLVSELEQNFAAIYSALSVINNGTDWICTQRNFPVLYLTTRPLIRELNRDRGRESEYMVDAAKARLADDINLLQTTVSNAQNLNTGWSELSEKIEAIQAATSELDEDRKAIKESVSNALSQAATSVTEVTESIESFRLDLENAKTELAESPKIQAAAAALLDEVTQQKEAVIEKLNASEKTLNDAIEAEKKAQKRLTEALKNVQMEGLAGSFTRMSNQVKAEIDKESRTFRLALIYLASIAVAGLLYDLRLGDTKDINQFIFRVLKMLAIAAPGVWIAWKASKSLNALNRIYSDYQYKSASALAYESYRQTVADSGNETLKEQLLAFAIKAFGDNPTQYYDKASGEAAAPTESFIEKLPFVGRSANPSNTAKV